MTPPRRFTSALGLPRGESVNPTLIDLHVRTDETTSLDVDTYADAAMEAGIDGIAVIGLNAAPKIVNSGEKLAVFAGVEVDTDVGRLLCYPKELDEWFATAGWQDVAKTNGGGPEVYLGSELVEAFSSRGGAVVAAQPYDRDLSHPCGEDAFVGAKGLTAVIVASSPRHTASNERAAAAALTAKLPCVAGSASSSQTDRFGTVATMFARPPADQAEFVEGLRAGRVWPVEIGGAREVRKTTEEPRKEQEAPPVAARRAPKKRRVDNDNRGNRLDLARLRSKPVEPQHNDRQPDFDPIARLYGLADRKSDRFEKWAGMSDDDLDRINGNRDRGPDPNVMSKPDFRVLRAERQHVNLLLQTIEESDEADSVALRFALHAIENADPDTLAEVEAQSRQAERNMPRRRRRRRRQ